MREEFEKLVAGGKIGRHHLEPLLNLAKSGYCIHRSWGVGRITTVDTVFSRFVIDFQSKPGHQMDLTFAAESLKPVASEHILARKLSDLNSLRQTAALHHLDLIKLVLQSFGGKATLDQIQQVLVPDVIADDWKKWWEVAKSEMKKDGHFQVPLKKTAPIVYQVKETLLDDRLLQDFRAAKGLKNKLVIAHELLKNLNDLNNRANTVGEFLTGLNADIVSHQRTMPALALEAVFLRDEILEASAQTAQAGELDDVVIWQQVSRPAQILDAIPAAKHKRALQSFRKAHPDNWGEILLAGLNSMSAKLCGECAVLLIHEGQLEQLKAHLARLIAQHQASAELLLWLGKERSDTFADILGPEVFRAMLTAMERDQFNEKRSNKLRDFILDDQSLLVELIGSADLEVIKDLTRALQLSPCFDDMDKRSLLARIVKSYPAVQSLISGDHKKEENTFIVSWESLERRKEEYTELVQKKMPANSKEIAIARSYGDLRENHEYKAAKEMQKLLMRRKAELEGQLVRARGTDFANARTDAVSIGTRVHVTELNSNHPETYTILGAWDSDPDKNVISYLTPVAQSLLNKKVADEVVFESHGVQKRYRIESIESAKAAPEPAPQPASAAG
jgi:transcription elongation factor GreA